MTNFTQKELEDEYIKRIKRHEQYKIALIDIWKLPDGTYIADFDDLPLNSDVDISNSFNKLT